MCKKNWQETPVNQKQLKDIFMKSIATLGPEGSSSWQAAKQFDPVLGVDIHIIQPPGPVPR